jgi:hypothetical protein
MNAKKFFLTFPKCTVSMHTAMERLKGGEHLEWAVVAEELHKDGTTHLHIALALTRKINITSEGYWDYVTLQHGNYQTMRSPNRCLEYITKDGKYLEHGISVAAKLAAAKSKQSYGFELCARELMSGKSVYEIAKEHPGFVCSQRIKLIGFANWWKMEQIAEPTTTWQAVKPHAGCKDVAAAERICEWLNRNVKANRCFKQKQLWIYGPANSGKTSIIRFIGNALRVFMMPNHQSWVDGYQDGRYDLVCFDEFKADRKLTWMNQWLQGSPFPVEVKNSFVMKCENLPSVILSNFSPEECYHKAASFGSLAFEALLARLEVVHCTAWMELDWAPVEDDEDISEILADMPTLVDFPLDERTTSERMRPLVNISSSESQKTPPHEVSSPIDIPSNAGLPWLFGE